MIKNKITSILFIFLRPISQAKLFCVIVIHNKTYKQRVQHFQENDFIKRIKHSFLYINTLSHEGLANVNIRKRMLYRHCYIPYFQAQAVQIILFNCMQKCPP